MRSGLWRQKKGVLSGRELFYAQMLAEALPRKARAAQAQSVKTLLGLGNFVGPEDVPVELFEAARTLLPSVFRDLPEADQRYLLFQQWPDLKSTAMIPVLSAITGAGAQYASTGLYQAALIRLLDLSPELVRPLILSEIGNREPHLGIEILGLLPDRELPGFDDVLLERVNRLVADGNGNMMGATALVERYASPALAGNLRLLLNSHIGDMDCISQVNLLAYFLRVAPRDGAELLGKALQQKQCSARLLLRLADLRMSSEVETAAIAALDDQDPQVVQEALRVLQRHGSVSAKQPIWDHFRRWHENLQGIGAAALIDPETQRFEGAYFEAAGTAQAWLTSPEELRTLGAFCATLGCKQNADQAAFYTTQVQFTIGFAGPDWEETTEHFGLGRYTVGSMDRLKEKMLQYPRGTEFRLDARSRQQRSVQRIFGVLKPWAVDHGFDLRLLRE